MTFETKKRATYYIVLSWFFSDNTSTFLLSHSVAALVPRTPSTLCQSCGTPFPLSVIFPAYWLRSTVVYVLLKLTLESPATAGHLFGSTILWKLDTSATALAPTEERSQGAPSITPPARMCFLLSLWPLCALSESGVSPPLGVVRYGPRLQPQQYEQWNGWPRHRLDNLLDINCICACWCLQPRVASRGSEALWCASTLANALLPRHSLRPAAELLSRVLHSAKALVCAVHSVTASRDSST